MNTYIVVSILPIDWQSLKYLLSKTFANPCSKTVTLGAKVIGRENVNIRIFGWGFPGGAVVKNPPANAGDTGLSSGLGRSHMPRSN